MNNNFRVHTFVQSLLAFLVLSSVTFVTHAAPNFWYVNDSTGNNSNNCLTSITACETIFEGSGAVTKAFSGDTINIAAGTYTESVSITNKSLTLIGEDPATTIIDATSRSNTINLSGGFTVSLNNLTLSNATNNGINAGSSGTLVIVRNVRVIDNDGTGIFVNAGAIDLKNVEISGNGNQGVHLNPLVTTADIVNTTISGNTDVGIGTANGPILNITNSTITKNGKAGLGLNNTTNIQNTIIAVNNTDLVDTVECYGTVNSLGNNISRDNTGVGSVCSFDQPGDWANTDPLLGPLEFNGAGTKTHTPDADFSVAINGGSKSGCPIDDQRGVIRDQSGYNVLKAQGGNTIVIPQEDGCDIGAYETDS